MKKINILFMIVLLFSLSFIHAELFQSSYFIIDNSTNDVYYEGYYFVDDTNSNNISTGTPINIVYSYFVEQLPYFTVDYCNLSIEKTTYSRLLFNITLNSSTYFYKNFDTSNTVSGISEQKSYTLYGRDQLRTEFKCHYSDLSNYKNNNRFPVITELLSSSYSCQECINYDYGTVINSSINYNPYSYYDTINILLSYDYQVLLILRWIVRLSFFFLSIGIIFICIYYLYKFVKNIEGAIR